MQKFIKNNYLQYVATFAVSIFSISFGFAMSWASPVLPLLQSDDSPIGIKLDLDQGSWVASLVLFGIIFGYAMIGKLMDIFGRKRLLLVAAIPVLAGWIMIFFAKSVELLYASRFMMGVALAVPIGVSVIYIAEISEPAIRGKLGIYNLMMVEVGMAGVQTIGNYVSYHNLAIISAIIPAVFFICFIWMPESPYYYLRKENIEDARAVLCRLRGTSDVEKELLDTKEYVKKEMASTDSIWDLFRVPKYRKSLFIVIALKSLQQISGSIAIINYMKTIFNQTSSGLSSDTSTSICTALPLPIMIAASYVVDKGGRRPLFFASTLGCAFGLLFEFIYFFMQDYLKEDVSALGWMPIFGIFVFYAFRAIGITPIPYIVLSELFSTNVKGKAVSVSLVAGGTLAFIVTRYFPLFADSFGMYTAFGCFTVVCVLGCFFVVFCMPETKGKSFADIQTQIEKETKPI